MDGRVPFQPEEIYIKHPNILAVLTYFGTPVTGQNSGVEDCFQFPLDDKAAAIWVLLGSSWSLALADVMGFFRSTDLWELTSTLGFLGDVLCLIACPSAAAPNARPVVEMLFALASWEVPSCLLGDLIMRILMYLIYMSHHLGKRGNLSSKI